MEFCINLIFNIMKNTRLLLTLICLLLSLHTLNAQSQGKAKLAIIEIDTRGIGTNNSFNTNDLPVTAITRLEIEKTGIYSVIDKYDLEYLIKRDSLNVSKCFSTYCIKDVASGLECDKVFTGSITKIADKLVISFKIFDSQKQDFEIVKVKEFLYLPMSIPSMIRITINEMFNLPNNEDEVNTLSRHFNFDESRNNPYSNRLRADGPRMGLTYFTEESAELMMRPR